MLRRVPMWLVGALGGVDALLYGVLFKSPLLQSIGAILVGWFGGLSVMTTLFVLLRLFTRQVKKQDNA